MADGPAKLERLDRTNRVHEVTERLRAHILAGDVAADDVLLSEGELARRLGVSRTVVREAMRSLQAQGLVEKSQGRRARLKPVDSHAAIQALDVMFQRTKGSLLHLMEVRRALEMEIAAIAAERATPEDIAGMEEAIAQQRKAPTLEESVEADVLFHKRLAAATGNRLFELLLETVSGVLRETVWRTLPKSGPQPAIDGHQKIAAAVGARDRSAAREAMAEHMEITESDLEGEREEEGGMSSSSDRDGKGSVAPLAP
jgi:GntR family transcriptional repressor for pyruvate dehydrogenase complex